ncbi:MAG: DUF402 domain-containing protein [Mycoplasmataceae bacterium]|jgi:protein associated with RNAse G/E|nr:DUF402 domain-containing protein [Mycoplasmataceae bacterium]
MINTKIKKIMVHAYKFNGTLYRTWEFPTIIEETDKWICVSTQNTNVLTIDIKKKKENVLHSKISCPTIWYFLKDKWYNIIFSNKKKTYCYINVASPFILEEEAIKYIDLDLDFKIPDIKAKRIVELDIDEYNENIKKYNYPDELIKKIKKIEEEILELYNSGELHKMYKYSKLLNNK